MITEEVAEEALRAVLAAAEDACEHHGVTGVEAAQFQFILGVHLIATVAQRSRLSQEYVAAKMVEMVTRAMDRAEADEHIDFHRGGTPS